MISSCLIICAFKIALNLLSKTQAPLRQTFVAILVLPAILLAVIVLELYQHNVLHAKDQIIYIQANV